jgi:hypothetical protein
MVRTWKRCEQGGERSCEKEIVVVVFSCLLLFSFLLFSSLIVLYFKVNRISLFEQNFHRNIIIRLVSIFFYLPRKRHLRALAPRS